MNANKKTWRNSGNIIVPGRFLEGNEIIIPKAKVFGRIRMEKFNQYGMLVANREFDNLITNSGLDKVTVAAGSQWYTICKVGTGTAAPAFTNTTLGAQVANTGTSGFTHNNSSALNQPATSTAVYTFALGAINANLTEVGLGNTSTNTDVRALIVDNLGNPTSFPVASNEQLKVTYIRGHYAPQSDIVTTQTLSGNVFGLTIRAIATVATVTPMCAATGSAAYARVSTQSTLPSYGGSVSGSGFCTSWANNAYSNGTYFQDMTATWAAGTATGTWSMVYLHLEGMDFACLYSPTLAKTSTMLLVLNFRVSWSRY